MIFSTKSRLGATEKCEGYLPGIFNGRDQEREVPIPVAEPWLAIGYLRVWDSG